ncbi:ubiquitin-conjugating enzyme family protein [Wolffia australiana]
MAQSDYASEQEMEIEALQAILMDEFQEIDPNESGLGTDGRCFQILLSPQDDDEEEVKHFTVQLALIFSHTPNYPDEPPHLNLKSIRGLKQEDLTTLKEKLQQEASENLGMAMVYTLVTSAKDWLTEKFGQEEGGEESDEDESGKEDVIIPHGEPVTIETFTVWRERFEAELALERAKLMPDSALVMTKEKKLSGRLWFESGRATTKGVGAITEEGSEVEDEEDVDLEDDFEDEDDMLDHYLAERSDQSSDGSRRGQRF